MKAAALLGGPKANWPQNLKEKLASYDLKFGVDRGSLLLSELGIKPDVAVGDFDSLRSAELAQIEKVVSDIRYSNPIKDFTDTELMLRAALLDYNVSSLAIYGFSGGRIDHFLSNMLMLLDKQVSTWASKVKLIDRQNLITYLLPGKNTLQPLREYQYFAVYCLTKTKKLSIKGARYDLQDYSTEKPRIFASNEFKNNSPCQISFKQGQVMIIYSKDIDRYLNA